MFRWPHSLKWTTLCTGSSDTDQENFAYIRANDANGSTSLDVEIRPLSLANKFHLHDPLYGASVASGR